MNRDVLRIYKKVMAVPEGPTGREYRKLTRKYVREMSSSEVSDVLSREAEIEERGWGEWRLRKEILMRLGFADGEAQFYARCRLNSPGIRILIKERVGVTKHATDDEIRRINEGDRGTLRALFKLYGGKEE